MKHFLKLAAAISILAISSIPTVHPDDIYELTPTGTIEKYDVSPYGISVALNSTTTIVTWFELEEHTPTDSYYPRYASWDGDSWITGTIEKYAVSYSDISVALNSTTTIVTWLENNPDSGCPRYATWNGTDWSNSGTIEKCAASPSSISVALNETTTIVTWIENTLYGMYPRYASWDGDSWITGTIEKYAASFSDISVALNETTTIVTWFEQEEHTPTDSYYPRYAFWNGTDWSNSGTIELYNASRDAISVACNSTTTIVTWLEHNESTGHHHPRYATWNGTDWSNSGTIELYDLYDASKYAISVDINETTTVVTWLEYDAPNFYVRYATWNEGSDSWTTGTIEKLDASGEAISVALNSTTTIVTWLEDLNPNYYPRWANLGIRSGEDGEEDGEEDGATTINVSEGNGHHKIPGPWVAAHKFIVVIDLEKISGIDPNVSTYEVYHQGLKRNSVYIDKKIYVEDPDDTQQITLTLKNSRGTTVASITVPPYLS